MRDNSKKGMIIMAILSIVAIIALIIVLPQSEKAKKAETKKEQTSDIEGAEQTEIIKLNGSGETVNTSKKINQNKELGDFTLSNVSLKETNGETVLSARITNKSRVSQAGFMGNIILLDKQNQEIGRMPVKISEMSAGETKRIEASITESYVDAYDYRLEK